MRCTREEDGPRCHRSPSHARGVDHREIHGHTGVQRSLEVCYVWWWLGKEGARHIAHRIYQGPMLTSAPCCSGQCMVIQNLGSTVECRQTNVPSSTNQRRAKPDRLTRMGHIWTLAIVRVATRSSNILCHITARVGRKNQSRSQRRTLDSRFPWC